MKKNPGIPYNGMVVDPHYTVGEQPKLKTRCVCNWAVEDEHGNMVCELPPEGGVIFLSEKDKDETEEVVSDE